MKCILQLAWARLKDIASFAWIPLLMARLNEVTPTLLSYKHDFMNDVETMEIVSRPYDGKEYDLGKVGFLVQPRFKYGSYVSKMPIFSFKKNLYTS